MTYVVVCSTRYGATVAESLSSVRNAARILKQFSAQHREYGVSELARELDLSKSTAHRLLSTLTTEGLLTQDEFSGKYRLGLAMYDLGAAVGSRLDLHEAVIPPMEVLRNRTRETVHVAVLDGREVVYVERLDSPHGLRLFLEVGRRNWAHSTGTGKCLLAFLSDQDLDQLLDGWELEQKTDETIVSIAELRKELRVIRKRGYAENRGEAEAGVLSISAPIRGPSGRVVAAVSAAGPIERVDPQHLKVVQAVRETAAIASKRLGFRD